MNDAALKPGTQDIVVDEVFPHAPETIWKTLTTGELIGRWMMAPTGFEPVEGKRFTFQTTPAGAWDGVIHCQVLEVMPNERLVYAWKGGHEGNVGYGSPLDTVVTWTLSRVESGTRLRLVHSGFVMPKNDTAFKTMSDGWKKVVPGIGNIAGEAGLTRQFVSGSCMARQWFARREDMSKAYTGGCACGAIRYEISGEPVFMNDCQCRDCQRKSGTGHGSYLTFPGKSSVKLEGEATHWDMVGDSGNVKTRAFCPTCGSPVYMTFAAMPDMFTVHAASLDDPSRYKPQAVTYAVRGYAWDHLDPDLPKFDKMPPM